jgi:hypothetical protein
MSRTQKILGAIGDPDGFALLDRLRDSTTEKQGALAKRAGVPGGTAAARVEVLLALGLVRRPSARGELSIAHPDAFEDVLAAADRLAELLLGEETSAQRARATRRDDSR